MSPIGDDCSSGGGGGACPVTAHGATGWCLAATGAPVLVITTVPCPPAEDGAVTVTLIDPSTGDVVAPQALVSCGNIDWEVNQLCDYDSVSGELLTTFIQVFEWDEDTGVLTISNVRADNPTIPYEPVGAVRSCTDDETAIDIEITPFCYNPDGPDPVATGWHQWVFFNGAHSADFYYDALGNVFVFPPAIIECPDPATESTLLGIEALIGTTNTELSSIDGHVDELEACCAATNAALTTILNAIVDGECVAATAFTHGQNTDIDSGAAEQIVVTSNPACNGVIIKAMPLNTGIVYIGLVGVTTVTGYPLEAGDTVTIPVDDANKVYAITDTDNQAVAWIAS